MKRICQIAGSFFLIGIILMFGVGIYFAEPNNPIGILLVAGFFVALFSAAYIYNKLLNQIFYVVDDMKTGEPFELIESAFSGAIMTGKRVLYVRDVHNEELLFLVNEDIINFDEESRDCCVMKNKKGELVSVRKEYFYQIRSNRMQGLSVS